ncbi:MAG: RNase adapter RapZ [Bacteroidota bacterium]
MQETRLQLEALFEKWNGHKNTSFEMLPPSGSDRKYFRLSNEQASAIGVYNSNIPENKAFIGFTEHFFAKNIPVPQIYGVGEDFQTYLLQDLGNTILLDIVLSQNQENGLSDEVLIIYKKVIRQLLNIQVNGGEGLDYSLCFQRKSFDEQTIQWDLNAFKYYFLKLSGIPFNEQALEADFLELTTTLLNINMDYFMFRDFQARNIMMVDGNPYFIDYQAGRKGPLQYDLASLLFQARAALSAEAREELLDYYIGLAEEMTDINAVSFRNDYYAIVLIRTLQVLATYGLRGLYEKKPHFIKSIPFALENAGWLITEKLNALNIPTLKTVLLDLRQMYPIPHHENQERDKPQGLTIKVFSFSYKSGIPEDTSGHGGGFVFDCRGIYNPGRYKEYRDLTGRDKPVIKFLEEKSNIGEFVQNVSTVIEPTIKSYLERGFSSLSVGFGCTGGRHRSVYSADKMAAYLEEKFPVTVDLRHLQREIEGW